MMRLAQIAANKSHATALVTGESIGQVASQTMESLVVTNSVVDMPVFRPCIGMDKEEIVSVARRINTLDTSSLPYEDCCTLFTPRHPNIRPTIAEAQKEEAKLDVDGLISRAFENVRVITIN